MRILTWAALAAVGCTMLLARAEVSRAEEPWEKVVREAEADEDRQLEEARLGGTTRRVAAHYASRVAREPSALNHYLLGRALYYDGDAAGAERALRRTLQLEPGFWFANLRLAMLELQKKRHAEAEVHVRRVLERRPREPDALKLLAQLLMEGKDWDRAIRVLEDLLALEPTNLGVRRNLAFVLMEQGDWDRALKELRVLTGRLPRDPAVRWYYAMALHESGRLKEAAQEFERLVRLEKRDVRALDMLRMIYAKLEDWKSLQTTLERMLPLVDDPEVVKRVEEMIERLKSGEVPGAAPDEASESWPEDTWMALLERCTDDRDVEVRRKALQDYHAANFPRMPNDLVRRLHHEYETDPVCRRWLLRIMGQMQNPQLAQVTAFALRDPDAEVRAAAAETLGEIGTASGLIYLMHTLLGSQLDETPTEEQTTLLNAARRAVIQITQRSDTFGGSDAWVPGESLGAMRKDWMTWLAAPDGVHARLRAITDLEVQEDLRPHLHLLDDVADPEPRIARAAYGVLLRRSRKPSEDDVAARMWPRFPVFEGEALEVENLGALRGAVQAWWQAWVEERKRYVEEQAADPEAPRDD